MNFRQLGYLNVFILGLLLLPYILNTLNQKVFKTKSPVFRRVMKALRSLHKPLGVAFVASALIHGYMAMGGIRLHTGTLLYGAVLIQVILGGAFYRKKKKELFRAHRIMAMVVAGLFLLHWLVPSALSGLAR